MASFNLLFFHSLIRWFVLASLLCSVYIAYRGVCSSKQFTKADNAIRHWTATIAHIQLVIGIILYTQSDTTHQFWTNPGQGIHQRDTTFFGLIHITLMVSAIITITIGSALAKRKTTDKEKFKTMLIWFTIALLIIFIAIPWPFSPLAQRPLIR
jgi:cytochrome bd-type quinol oxidase subunit 2